MPDENALVEIQGMKEVLNEISFLDSFKINDEYIIPAMKEIGGLVKIAEKKNVPVFSSKTARSISSRITTNGIGSVTTTIGPSKKRAFIFRFITGGAVWHDTSSSLPPQRWNESKKIKGNRERVSQGRKLNPSILPAAKLVEWVKSKLGAGDDALQVAFRVAKAIGQRGLSAKPIVQPTVEEVQGMVVQKMNEAMDKMVQEIGKHANG